MTKRKNKKVTANRNYKDTVFRKLFSDRRNLLSLYNAINGTAYTDETKLEIVTLENAIYMGMKNDLAFIIDTNLFLYEHQSTYNRNIMESGKCRTDGRTVCQNLTKTSRESLIWS